MNSLTQSSIRRGRFKKKFLTIDQLKIEAKALAPKIQELFDLHQHEPAYFTASVILLYLKSRYPFHWQGSQLNPVLNISAPILNELGFLFQNRSFKSTPLSVNRSLLSWGQNTYNLKLFTYIPSPMEVLECQSQFGRCVTVLLKESEINHFILGERDHLSFIMHDLIHADHFFHLNHMGLGQVGFYRQMKTWIKAQYFNKLLQENAEYKSQFEYLISDMNAHCVHLWKGFKSITLKAAPGLWQELLHEISNESIQQILEKLNTPYFDPQNEAQELSDWCEKWVEP